MPIYEYVCEKCGHRFERLIRAATDRPASCPRCQAPKPVKQFSTFRALGTDAASGGLPCDSGACDTGACSTGACPYGG